MVGRLILAKTVPLSLSLHWSSALHIPKGVAKKLYSIIKNFPRSGNANKRGSFIVN